MPIKVAVIAAAALAAPGVSTEVVDLADEDGVGWHAVRMTVDLTGRRPFGEYVVYTEDETRPGAALSCRGDDLRVGFSIEGTGLRETLTDVFPRSRREVVTLTIAGAKADESNYAYLPEYKIFRAQDRLPAAKVFNAVVQEQAVTIKRDRSRTTVDVGLPPVDESFKRFVDGCKELGAI